MTTTILNINNNSNIDTWDYGIKGLIKKLLQQNQRITQIIGENIFCNNDAKKDNFITIEINSLKELPPNRAKANITISIFINNPAQKLDQTDDLIINEIKKIFFNEINFQEKNTNKTILMFQREIKQSKNISSINYDAFVKIF